MQEPVGLGNFIKSTAYTAPVDIKKLKFMYAAIEEYASRKGKKAADLRVLEVACGRGGITLPLASLGCHVTAFDVDEKAVEYLRTQLERKNILNVVVSVDNGYTFNDGKDFDIVIASEVFEHVLDPSRLADNIAGRMLDGAYLIVTTPNGYGPWELNNRLNVLTYLKKWNVLRKLLGKPSYQKGAGGDHCQFYTKNRLVKLFSTHSLQPIGFMKSDSFLAVLPPLRRSRLFGVLDITMADVLPHWLASGWYFTFQLQRSSK